MILKINDIVVLKPEEVDTVKPYARPWVEGPYVVTKADLNCDEREVVEVVGLRDKAPLAFGGGINWVHSTRFTVLSDADIFGEVDRCAITGLDCSGGVEARNLLEVLQMRRWYRTSEARALYKRAANECGVPYTSPASSKKTRVDNARIIFRARELYAQEVYAHGIPTVPRPVQPQPSASASQSNCTVARCPAQASALFDNRSMCDMHAKEFALWQKEQNRQVEQAKAELDRPYQRWFGSGDVGGNPWNR